jgi:hypothetical protein
VEGRRKGQFTCFLDEVVDGIGLRTKQGEEACCYDVSFFTLFFLSCGVWLVGWLVGWYLFWLVRLRMWLMRYKYRLTGGRGIMFAWALFTRTLGVRGIAGCGLGRSG